MSKELSNLIEYMKVHVISLNQDMEKDLNIESKINIQGQIIATRHLLSVATDILHGNYEFGDWNQ